MGGPRPSSGWREVDGRPLAHHRRPTDYYYSLVGLLASFSKQPHDLVPLWGLSFREQLESTLVCALTLNESKTKVYRAIVFDVSHPVWP